jgi:catechol 2,3-dioxygenase-like lactoylglutathione lyase family enzyme
MPVGVDEIVVADPPELWAALGFRVIGDACDIGTVRIRLAGPDAGKRIVGWSLRGVDTAELDGPATTLSTAPPREPAAAHPNAVTAVDHVVAFCPDLDRAIERLEAAGLDLRRVREEPTPAGAPRQAFFRLGEVILECIQMPDSPELDRSRSARLWGLALRTENMDRTVSALGDRLGEPREAVQQGRTIATLKREAGSTVPLAFMTPPPERAGR